MLATIGALERRRYKMKKIFALCLTLALILSLCACDVPQAETVLNGNFMIIENYTSDTYLVATKDTSVIYVLEHDGYRGFLSPYLIYEDGAIYGAVWINEEIVPVPFATN
jgi:predicted membrane metal-binding protein